MSTHTHLICFPISPLFCTSWSKYQSLSLDRSHFYSLSTVHFFPFVSTLYDFVLCFSVSCSKNNLHIFQTLQLVLLLLEWHHPEVTAELRLTISIHFHLYSLHLFNLKLNFVGERESPGSPIQGLAVSNTFSLPLSLLFVSPISTWKCQSPWFIWLNMYWQFF